MLYYYNLLILIDLIYPANKRVVDNSCFQAIGIYLSVFGIDHFAAGFYQYSIGQCALPFRVDGLDEFVLAVARIDIIQAR